jgi:hypothetical protein
MYRSCEVSPISVGFKREEKSLRPSSGREPVLSIRSVRPENCTRETAARFFRPLEASIAGTQFGMCRFGGAR